MSSAIECGRLLAARSGVVGGSVRATNELSGPGLVGVIASLFDDPAVDDPAVDFVALADGRVLVAWMYSRVDVVDVVDGSWQSVEVAGAPSVYLLSDSYFILVSTTGSETIIEVVSPVLGRSVLGQLGVASLGERFDAQTGCLDVFCADQVVRSFRVSAVSTSLEHVGERNYDPETMVVPDVWVSRRAVDMGDYVVRLDDDESWSVAVVRSEATSYIHGGRPVALARVGRDLVAGLTKDHSIMVWDTSSPGSRFGPAVDRCNTLTALLPYGGGIVSADVSGSVRYWELDDVSGARSRLVGGSVGGPVVGLVPAVGGRLMIGYGSGLVSVWDPRTGVDEKFWQFDRSLLGLYADQFGNAIAIHEEGFWVCLAGSEFRPLFEILEPELEFAGFLPGTSQIFWIDDSALRVMAVDGTPVSVFDLENLSPVRGPVVVDGTRIAMVASDSKNPHRDRLVLVDIAESEYRELSLPDGSILVGHQNVFAIHDLEAS